MNSLELNSSLILNNSIVGRFKKIWVEKESLPSQDFLFRALIHNMTHIMFISKQINKSYFAYPCLFTETMFVHKCSNYRLLIVTYNTEFSKSGNRFCFLKDGIAIHFRQCLFKQSSPRNLCNISM